MKNRINNLSKLFVLIVFFSLSACSYSPQMLKEAYSELGSDFGNEIKQTIDLSATQNAKVDHYISELMKWHRQNKLPEYSQLLSHVASSIQQPKPSVVVFQKALMTMQDVPHFDQARHLTPMMADIANSLSRAQISQLEKSLKNEYEKEKYEIKAKKLPRDITQGYAQLFSFLETPLNAKQKKILKDESVKFYDLRWYELQYYESWYKRFVSLLKKPKSPQFRTQFAKLWNTRETRYTGAVLQKHQQNIKRQATLLTTLIASFDQEKKNKLASKLQSMSNTLSELANR